MRWCFLQGRRAPVANELVSTQWRHLIGQYVFKFPGGIPFVEDLEYFSTVDGEGKTMLWQPGGTIYPARVDLHDLVTTCPPEQGPGPDLSFFEEYVNFLQGLIDLFFSHFFTYWPDDSRRPGGEGSLSVSNFLFCKVPGNQRVDFWFRPFDSFLVYSVLPFFPFVAGSFATGCYRVFPSLFLLPFCRLSRQERENVGDRERDCCIFASLLVRSQEQDTLLKYHLRRSVTTTTEHAVHLSRVPRIFQIRRPPFCSLP